MKRWTIKKHDREAVKMLADDLRISPVVAALLISRGYETREKAHKFLNPSLADLHEPNLLKGMNEAVGRILKAVEAGEKILIWGDYDVDGTTGTVVLRKALEILGAKTGFHIPHRFTEGYGVNIPALEKAKERGYTLVVSVDCGIRSFEPIAWAKQNGIDFIVTDHHLSDETKENPDAFAVVNPNQPDCEYPDKNLAGVGVAFKLAHALLREKGRENLVKGFLKIVAIGTIADVMNLTGENRAIVTLGLKDLPKAHNYGLKALMEVADCTGEMTSYDIGFRLAPRINAAGRMDAARHIVELFETTDFDEARSLAEMLNSRNRERQKVQAEITGLAMLSTLDSRLSTQNFVVVAGEGWHRGVIGLAASKIAEKLYRPTIVFSIENGIAHGSARSIAGYHLLQSLDSCAELFEQYGGHAAAAGMKIKTENIEKLQEKLNAHAGANLSAEDLIPELKIDAVVSSQTLNLDLVEELKRLEPFGMGNPKPRFLTKDLVLTREPFVMKDKHLKLKLADQGGKQFEAVWWDGVDKSKEQNLKVKSRIELAYAPEANNWNGNTRLQLVVEDFRENR
ncbi:MAG TPA: single-stranded-DNA-specific exonuclease RecJ [Pyrinomonadaceae bacterium]|nr:single-stranded-DNA-specific exonuclease RecJ [Pyrinomonadaceae bacterium]